MSFLYSLAKHEKCKVLFSYVDENGKAIPFYKREGFNVLGTVNEFLEDNKSFRREYFDSLNDFIIAKRIS